MPETPLTKGWLLVPEEVLQGEESQTARPQVLHGPDVNGWDQDSKAPPRQDSEVPDGTFHDGEVPNFEDGDVLKVISHIDQEALQAALRSAMEDGLTPKLLFQASLASATHMDSEPIPPQSLIIRNDQPSAYDHDQTGESQLPGVDVRTRTTVANTSMLAKMRGLRLDVIGKRLQVREQRTALRQQRGKSSNHDRDILAVFTRLLTPGSNIASMPLTELLETSIQLREQVVELETAYDDAENDLNREEWELKEAENKYYASISTYVSDTLVDTLDGLSESTVTRRHTQSTAENAGPQLLWLDVLEERYLSRKGDVDIIEEQLDELELEIAQMYNLTKYLHGQGRELSETKAMHLADAEDRRNILLEELGRAQEDMFSHQNRFNEHQDLLFDNYHFGKVGLAGPGATAPEIQERPDQLIESVQPLLHEMTHSKEWENKNESFNHAQKTQRFIDAWILPTETPDAGGYLEVIREDMSSYRNMQRFINRWWLNSTRTSRLESAQCYNWINGVGADMAMPTLVDVMLQYWNSDATGDEAGYENPNKPEKGSLEYDYDLQDGGSDHSTGLRSGSILQTIHPFQDSIKRSSQILKEAHNLRRQALRATMGRALPRSNP